MGVNQLGAERRPEDKACPQIVEDITGDPDKAVEASRAIQLAIQYHPGPPNTPPPGGDPDNVNPKLLEAMRRNMSGFKQAVCEAVRAQIDASA